MAVTLSVYSHVPKLIAHKDIDFSNWRLELLNNTATFNAAHTTKASVDNGGGPVTVTISIASPGVVTHNAHGFSNGQAVKLKTTGALPTGLTANTWYYTVNVATNTYQLAATPGGTAINTTGTQSGVHSEYSSGSFEVFGNGWSPGGPAIPNVTETQAAITDATNNDCMIDADDVVVTASGGSIGPAFKALIYDQTNEFPIAFLDFGGSQSAGDTTDFKVRWNSNGILNLTQ